MKEKKKTIISIFCVLSVLLIAIGVTYSIFTYTKKGDTQNTITTGKLTFLYTENTGTGSGINITNAFPVSDELGKAYSSDDQVFDFKVESEIVGDNSIPYEVTVGKTSTSTMNEKNIKLYLTDTTENTEVDLLEPTLYNSLPESATEETEKQIYFDEVDAGEDYLKNFRLRMWIDENSIQEEINEKTFTVKVNVYSNEEVVKKSASTNDLTLVNDVNSNGTADVGDEIALGSEHFYVISNDGKSINALAKYNLKIGGTYDDTNDEFVPFGSEATGLQDPLMKETIVGDDYFYPGVIGFDSAGSLNDFNNAINNINSEYLLKLKTLNDKVVSVHSITKNELFSFGCADDQSTEILNVSPTCNIEDSDNTYLWVYGMDYMTSFLDSNGLPYSVGSDGELYNDLWSNENYAGIRPVVVIKI